ncbi:hypothetical protein HID58_043272 [Brassica napus]|uniref:Small EDRK-rich factor-like N-terminal domain-containing protein n=1 Tax=Brassica napus TaxID=3708 RepID=A0ABQ8BG08_BRANA|nr:hypothetical protein HID58_043272 [Brassica napus]
MHTINLLFFIVSWPLASVRGRSLSRSLVRCAGFSAKLTTMTHILVYSFELLFVPIFSYISINCSLGLFHVEPHRSQRERDRERAQARAGGKGKTKDDGLTPEQRRERDAKALQEKAAKKAAQAAGAATSGGGGKGNNNKK